MFFQRAFGNCIFSSFYIKNIIFGLQLGPQLGVKNLHFFSISHQELKKPDGNPKSQSKPALDASRTLRNLEDELLDVENLHFSAPRLLKT